MTDFALIDLGGPSIVGEPGPLPEMFMPRDRKPVLATLADLTFTGTDYGGAYVGNGFWPVVEVRPALAAGQRYATPPSYTINSGPKTVTATYTAESDPVLMPALAKAKADADTKVRAEQEMRSAIKTLKAKGLIS